MSMNLAQLNNTYKNKWVNEFGNASSEKLETMWSDIFTTLSEVQRRNTLRIKGITNAPNKEPLNVVFSSTMGTGKSTSVQHYLLNGLDTTFYKALVVVELIETCNEYAEVLQSKGAVAVHSENGKTLEDNLEAPILIITHNRLASLLHRGVADSVFNEYGLVVIDEQVNTYQHISFNYKEINTYLKSILEASDSYNGDIKEFSEMVLSSFTEIKRAWKGSNDLQVVHGYSEDSLSIIDWNKYADDLESKMANIKGLSTTETKKLKSIVYKLRVGSKQGRMKLVFWQQNMKTISFNVVIDFLPTNISKVLFDGTASVNDTYKLINKYIGADTIDVREYHKLRSFKNSRVKYYTMATGKGSLTVSALPSQREKYNKEVADVKASMSELISNTISRYGAEEKVLFIIHKANVEYLEPLLPDTNYTYTWWGKHVGSNEWKEYSKVVVYGLNYLPENVYTAMYYSTFGINTNTELKPTDDLKAGLLSVDILQAIFRGSLRTVLDDEGNCSTDCEVIISLPNNNLKANILERMGCILWDSTYEEIQDGALPINSKSKNREKMTKLILELKSGGKTLYRDKSSDYIEKSQEFCVLASELSTSNETLRELLIRGAQIHTNKKLLLDNNFVYCTPTDENREAYGLSGNVKKIFKFIGSFKDETPTTDVNGLEF